MGRRWYHEVSAEWLKARQDVLTATDVANLLPEYKRYLKAGSPDTPTPGFSALWCKKHSDVYLDTSSSDAAARGHIMEPYAIEELNKHSNVKFYHWDDCIITNNIFGFSPDGMTVDQLTKEVKIDSSRVSPWQILEVKSYSPEQHMKSLCEERMDHKELMQLAMSFVVLDSLEIANILWFCPGAPIPMFTEAYTRDDLHDQIRWILEIAEVYLKTDRFWKKAIKEGKILKIDITEDEIYQDYMAEQGAMDMFTLK